MRFANAVTARSIMLSIVVTLVCHNLALADSNSRDLVKNLWKAPTSIDTLNQTYQNRILNLKDLVQRNDFSLPVKIDSPNIEILNCEKYPKGSFQLRSQIKKGLEKGIQCLANIDLNRRYDAEALSILFNSNFGTPVKILCGDSRTVYAKSLYSNKDGHIETFNSTFDTIGTDHAVATATPPMLDGWPAILLNLSEKVWRGGADGLFPEEILFHESLHLLGYTHDYNRRSGTDFVYDAQKCCFHEDYFACEDLRKEGPSVFNGSGE
jgi:hypothetical protein